MSYVRHDMHGLAELVETKPSVQRHTATATFQCLVVSTSDPRREMLYRAAADGGWDVTACANVKSATRKVQRTFFHLSLVDLEGDGRRAPSGFRELCKRLCSDGIPLLAVCGHEGNAEEEIWARQLGVWLYLPGVESGENVSALCGEALKLAGQWARTKRPAVKTS